MPTDPASSRLGNSPEVMAPMTPIPGERSARQVPKCTCGCTIPSGAVFCRMCGKKVEISVEESPNETRMELDALKNQIVSETEALNNEEKQIEIERLRRQCKMQQEQLELLAREKQNLHLEKAALENASRLEAEAVEQEQMRLECNTLRQQLQVVRQQREKLSSQLTGAQGELDVYRQKEKEIKDKETLQNLNLSADSLEAEVEKLKDFGNGNGNIYTADLAKAPTEDMVYDFVILGAGSAGAIIAGRLSEDPAMQVCLVEAGAAPPESEMIPDAGATMVHNPATDWEYTGDAGAGNAIGLNPPGRMHAPRGKMLGGSSSLGYCVFTRGHPGDFDEWAQKGAKGWSYADVLPFFKRVESLQDARHASKGSIVVDEAAHGRSGPINLSVRNPILPVAEVFLDACKSVGLPVIDYNGRTRGGPQGGASHTVYSTKDGQRNSAFRAYLEPAMTRPNLKVIIGANVTRVALEGLRAVGAEYQTDSGEIKVVRASKEVVVSCGAFNSPAVLLRSGIGPRRELQGLGIPCVVDKPHVGKHMKDHFFVGLLFPAPRLGVSVLDAMTAAGSDALRAVGILPEDPSNDGTLTQDQLALKAEADRQLAEYLSTGRGLQSQPMWDGLAFWNSGLGDQHTHDAGLSMFTFGFNKDLLEGLFSYDVNKYFGTPELADQVCGPTSQNVTLLAHCTKPRSEGEVRLASTDVLAQPVVLFNYLSDANDMRVFKTVMRRTIEVGKAMKGVGQLHVPHVLRTRHGGSVKSGVLSDAFLEDYVRHFINTLWDVTSTCRMPDVVDAKLSVQGIQGLRVADASIFPNITSGGTMAPCHMVGEKASEIIAREYGVALKDAEKSLDQARKADNPVLQAAPVVNPAPARSRSDLQPTPFTGEAAVGQVQTKQDLIESSKDAFESGDNQCGELILLMELEHRRKTWKLQLENEALREELSASMKSDVQSALDEIPARRDNTSVIDLLRPAEQAHAKEVSELETERQTLMELKFGPGGRRSTKGSLEDEEVEERPQEHFSDGYKDFMIFILYMAVFFDVLGTSIFIVSAPMVYMSSGCAELGDAIPPPKKESIEEGLGMFADEAKDVGFATCINLGVSLFSAAGVISKLTAPLMAKFIGKKGSLCVFLFGGGIVYILTWLTAPKYWDMPWVYFLAMRFICGLLGGSSTIATMLISDYYINDVQKRELRIGLIFVFFLLSISCGPVIGQQLVGDQQDPEATLKPFLPLLFAAGGSFFIGIFVVLFVRDLPVEPPPVTEDGGSAEDEPIEPDKLIYIRYAIAIFGARAFDSLGDGAPTYTVAVGLAKFGLQPDFSKILVTIAFMGILALPICFTMKDYIGYAATCFIGQLLAAGLLAGIALIPAGEGHSTPMFLGMLFSHYVFTAFAILCRTNMILRVVPKKYKDAWLARTDALDDMASVVSPYVLVKILDNEEWGPYGADGPDGKIQPLCDGTLVLNATSGLTFPALGVKPDCGCMGGVGGNTFGEGAYLVANGIMNASSCVCYIFLLAKFPLIVVPETEYVEAPVTEEDMQALELYRNTGQTMKLRFDLQYKEYTEMLASGVKPKRAEFGRFADDKAEMETIFSMSHNDMLFYKEVVFPSMIEQLQDSMSSKAKRKMLADEMAVMAEVETMDVQQKWDVGRWLMDYLVYAGYRNPAVSPRVWKMLFMTAFPKLCYPYGFGSPMMAQNPIPQIEGQFKVVSKILDLEKTRAGLASKAQSAQAHPGGKFPG